MNHSYHYTIEDIRANFSNSDFSRGYNYQCQKKVISLDVIDNKLTAKVQGTRAKPYQVEVLIKEHNSRISFLATCTCPVGSTCKHMAAALIEGITLSKMESQSESQITKLDSNLSRWLESLTPTQEKDRKSVV